MIRLHFLNGPLAGHSFSFEEESVFLGRDPDNHIHIKDLSVSRKHARLFRKGNELFIEDLDSENGVWVGGAAIKSGEAVPISEGLPIALGNSLLTVGRELSGQPVVSEYSIDLSWHLASEYENFSPLDTLTTDRKKLERFYEVTALLLSSSDLEGVCKRILDCLFVFLKKMDAAAIFLVDHQTGELRQVASRARSSSSMHKVAYSPAVVYRTLRQAKVVMICDTSREKRPEDLESLRIKGVKSMICLPLMSETGPVGVIYLHAVDQAQAFQKEDLFFYAGLSSLAALAVESALFRSKSRLAEENLQRARQELESQVKERTAELVQANKQMEELSITDALTGLYNYRYLMRVLDSEYKRSVRYKHRFALLMVDVDRFKDVNDTYSHPCGDFVLQGLGRLLRECVRNTDVVARYGGDEMAIVLLEVDMALALEVAQKLRKEVEKRYFVWETRSLRITVSIGVAAAPQEGIKDWNDLVKASDQALYRAKEAGRNLVVGFSIFPSRIE
jgi:diguanylate cyclase (GGDEF)-like protein